MAWASRGEDPLYRARVTMGERLLRELQLQAQGRVPGPGIRLYTEGSEGPYRMVEAPLQPAAATLIAGLPAARPEDHLARGALAALLWRCGGMSPANLPGLTLKVDHLVGSGQLLGGNERES